MDSSATEILKVQLKDTSCVFATQFLGRFFLGKNGETDE